MAVRSIILFQNVMTASITTKLAYSLANALR